MDQRDQEPSGGVRTWVLTPTVYSPDPQPLSAPAGVARYITTGPCAAEIAFEVADRHHGHGLGSLLLDTVLDSNQASQHLLSLVGLTLRPSGGLLEADGRFRLLDRPRLERPAVVSAAFAARQGVASDRSPRDLVA